MTKFNKIISLAVLLIAGNTQAAKSSDSLYKRLSVCEYKAATNPRWYSIRNNSWFGTSYEQCAADIISDAESAAKESANQLAKLPIIEQAAAHILSLSLRNIMFAQAVADAAATEAALTGATEVAS